MLIAQMTDIHIGFDRDAGSEELNLARYHATLARLLEQPNQLDMLVLSGDLTEHGDAESFARLVEPLKDCSFPVYPLVGNHDSREALLAAFPDCPSDGEFIHYAIEQDGLLILCLDTFEPGRHGGAFCDKRAAWLADQLAAHADTPTLIFMHHPPVVSGIDWMDPAPNEDWIESFAGAVDGQSQILAIHCGHLHRQIHTRFRGFPLGTTPSVAPLVSLDLRPIDPQSPDGRDLITTEDPAYALHRWDGESLVTHYERVSDWDILARYDDDLKPMISSFLAERE